MKWREVHCATGWLTLLLGTHCIQHQDAAALMQLHICAEQRSGAAPLPVMMAICSCVTQTLVVCVAWPPLACVTQSLCLTNRFRLVSSLCYTGTCVCLVYSL